MKEKTKLFTKLRSYFLAGCLVITPIAASLYVAYAIISFADHTIQSLIPSEYILNMQLPFCVPGIGLLFVLCAITLIGALTAGACGRFIVQFSERIFERTPIVRVIYTAIKQVMQTLYQNQSKAFQDVVMIEYPRKGIWSLGFITGQTKGEVQKLTEDVVINVFIPTTPNPTSGFLLFVPKKDIRTLKMSVEDGVKMVISAGIVTPTHRGPIKEEPFQSNSAVTTQDSSNTNIQKSS